MSIGIDLIGAGPRSSRTAPKLESEPTAADPFCHIDITSPLFTREPQRQLNTPQIGKPAGMLMYSTFLPEPKLIGFAYDLEQRVQVPRPPQFLDSVTPVPNADLRDQHPEPQSCVPGNGEDASAQPHLLS